MTCEVLALLNGADLGFIPSFSVMLSKKPFTNSTTKGIEAEIQMCCYKQLGKNIYIF